MNDSAIGRVGALLKPNLYVVAPLLPPALDVCHQLVVGGTVA
jgi:hypothetical protein